MKKKAPHNKRWKAINTLLAPLMPASNIVSRLDEEYGITLTLRAVYNWRMRGVSDACTPAIAEMTGKSVEDVLEASGKI
jgi:hypothetical protein